MKCNLKNADMVQEAAKTGGKNVIIEILMFLGLYFAIEILVVIPAVLGVMVILFANPDYMSAAMTGNVEKIETMTNEMLNAEGFMVFSLLVTVIMILVPMLFAKFVQKRKMRTLGFKKAGMWKEYGIGLLVGFGMMSFMVIVGVLTGAMNLEFNKDLLTAAGIGFLFVFLIGFVIQGMSEEVLCRGYFLVSLARKKGNIWLGVIVNAVAFGMLHLGNPGITVLSMVNLILFGIFASIYFVKRGSIWGIAAIHTIWNFAQGNIYGALVSGMTFGTSVFKMELNEEMTLINGGSFGLEGGILTTIVMVAGIIIMLMTKQKDIAIEVSVAEKKIEEVVAEA